jgi:hypothetical protein
LKCCDNQNLIIMKQNYHQKLFFAPIKRQSFLTVVLFVLAFGANAQISTFPWMETFEDNSPSRGAWTQIYEVNNMSWTFATSPSTGGGGVTAYEGVKFANYPGTSHDFDKTKLVSPVLDLSAVSNPSVSFYFRNPFWNPDQNWLRIFYRTSESAAWVQIAEFHSDVRTWTSSGDIALPSPSATYQIAVEVETDYGYSTTVDALEVKGNTLGLHEFSKSVVKYYPNPTGGLLNLSSGETISDVTVFNLLGQKVLESTINSNQGQLDISSLTSGNYVIHANTEKGKEIFKIVKK